MDTDYTKFELYMDAIDARARELAIARINAERTTKEHVSFWELVMENEDKRLAAIVNLAIGDGVCKKVIEGTVQRFVDKWDKALRDPFRHEVLQ